MNKIPHKGIKLSFSGSIPTEKTFSILSGWHDRRLMANVIYSYTRGKYEYSCYSKKVQYFDKFSHCKPCGNEKKENRWVFDWKTSSFNMFLAQRVFELSSTYITQHWFKVAKNKRCRMIWKFENHYSIPKCYAGYNFFFQISNHLL